QNEDGGFPAKWSHNISSLDATCFRLAQAEQLGLTMAEKPIQTAVRYLVRRQSLDGSWEEDVSLSPYAPKYLKPGTLEPRLYLTANCGFWVAYYAGRDNAVPRAMGFLMRYLEENGCLPSYPQTNWMSAGLWLRMRRYEVADKVVTACQGHMEDLPASSMAWMGVTMIISRIRQKNPIIRKAADKLLALRKEGDYWESEDGKERNCHTTIEAIRVLKFTKKL
ncbi:MAG: terpene cyclase/mutase family protein, partial [Anaerolineaceae bacterium]|nr:terpene cyclase/mutase family protein [Anaerolineaceae bacterium]